MVDSYNDLCAYLMMSSMVVKRYGIFHLCLIIRLVTWVEMLSTRSLVDNKKLNFQSRILNPFKPSIILVVHRQTVQTLIRRRRTRRLIRVSTVCLQKVVFEF